MQRLRPFCYILKGDRPAELGCKFSPAVKSATLTECRSEWHDVSLHKLTVYFFIFFTAGTGQ